MANIIIGKSNVLEYVVESTFATFPTNPTMQWLGVIQDGKFIIDNLPEDLRGLKDYATYNKLEIIDTVSLGQELSLDLDYNLQNWNLFKAALLETANIWVASTAYVIGDTRAPTTPNGYLYKCTTGGTSAASQPTWPTTVGATVTDGPVVWTCISPSNSLNSLSFGVAAKDGTKFAKFSGFKINSVTAEFAEKKPASVKMKLVGAHVAIASNTPWSITDYKGTGAHATIVTTAPIGLKDLVSCTWNGAAIPNSAIGNIKFGIENHLEAVMDAYATTSTKIGAIEPDIRDFKCTMTIKRKTIDNIVDKIFAFAGSQSIVLTFPGPVVLTFSNAKIAKEEIDSAPKGMVSVDYDFVGINNLVFS